MKLKYLYKYWIINLILIISIAGCRVMFIGAYDQVTDESIQQIQTEVSTLLVKIEKNITNNTPDENKYENLKNEYDNIEGKIKSLEIRANSLPKYKIISQQIITLENNIKNLEEFNKIGFTNLQPVQIIDSTFQVQFSAMAALQNGLKREKITK